ncbi:MAG: transposase family protein, partial [Syntrophobacteraceae bacterium]
MNEWVTIKDFAAATGVTARAAQKKIAQKGWRVRDAEIRGRGRPPQEIFLGCLSRDDQEKVAKYRLAQKLSVPEVVPPPCPAPSAPPAVSSVMAVPDRADQIGLAKYNIIRAWRSVLENQPHGKKVEATEAFLHAYNAGQLLPRPFGLVGPMAAGTLRELDKKLRASRDENNGAEDYRVICDGRGGWKKHGTTRWRVRSLSDDAKEVLLSCWLRPEQPTVSLAIRAARMTLERRGIVEEAEDRTWRRWLDDWSRRSQHIIVLAREGEKAYRDKVGPYITRDDSMLEPGQVLIADGHDLNIEILHPYTGKPARLKLVMFFDWASRMPAGWQIMPTENTVVIQAALRNAIINLGKVPQVVYLDNGRAFKAKVFTQTDPDLSELSGLYARLGIATQFSQPYNARAKIIERFFETLNEQFERLISSYTGASIGDKPAWRSRNEKFHKAQHLKRTGGWIPDIREAAWLVSLYIQWYGQQEHSGIHFQKPAEVLASGRGPGVDVSALNEKCLWTKRVTPRRCR